MTLCGSEDCKREERRHTKHLRRVAGERRIQAESKNPISLRSIAERDGWKCHVCGKKVPKKFGNYKNAPSIDHLVPLTNYGGAHVPENVRLAHKDCNTSRGERGAAQLLLFG